MFVLQNVQFFCPFLRLSIKGNYGHARLSSEEYAEKERDGTLTPQDTTDQRLPGLFCLYSYLQHVLNTCGEEIILNLVSMVWQIGINMVYAETLLQERVRHNKNLEVTDLVLVYCVGTHYVGASKCFPWR